MDDAPLVRLHLRASAEQADACRLTIESLRAQCYANWQLQLEVDRDTVRERRLLGVNPSRDPRIVVAAATDATVATTVREGDEDVLRGWLCPGDRLASHALLFMVRLFVTHPELALVFADDDRVAHDAARVSPRFKPDLDLDLLRATCYIGRACMVRNTAAAAALSESGSESDAPAELHAALFDLVLRIVEREGLESVRHVPRVLFHCGPVDPVVASGGAAAIVSGHLMRCAPNARVMPEPAVAGACRVQWPLPLPAPHVTLIVPTREQEPRLRTFVDSLFARTDYPSFDLLVVDNGSRDRSLLAYLASLDADPRVSVRYDARPFNWSALNNAAAGVATGSVLGFLNDDLEVIESGWLSELVSQVLRPDVGVGGARLWYPDDRVQHAGVVLHPQSGASHVHQGLERGATGYLGRAALQQSMAAVTGACLFVRAAVFGEVGGFDESFDVDFNDVDFCLRAATRGYRTVWTPHANLRHDEGATRGSWNVPANRRRFERAYRAFAARWGARMSNDPAFNPNLAVTLADPPLAWPPRVPPL